jgi:putative endonuclease
VGDRAEKLAAKMLQRKGFRVLARNVRTSGGEADLVMLAPDRRTIVLVEVKGRINTRVGAAVAINAQKRARLVRTIEALRREQGWGDRPCRIDVVTVEWPQAGHPPEIKHYENAVGASV